MLQHFPSSSSPTTQCKGESEKRPPTTLLAAIPIFLRPNPNFISDTMSSLFGRQSAAFLMSLMVGNTCRVQIKKHVWFFTILLYITRKPVAWSQGESLSVVKAEGQRSWVMSIRIHDSVLRKLFSVTCTSLKKLNSFFPMFLQHRKNVLSSPYLIACTSIYKAVFTRQYPVKIP